MPNYNIPEKKGEQQLEPANFAWHSKSGRTPGRPGPQKKGPRRGQELLLGGNYLYLGPFPDRGSLDIYCLTMSMFILTRGSSS